MAEKSHEHEMAQQASASRRADVELTHWMRIELHSLYLATSVMGLLVVGGVFLVATGKPLEGFATMIGPALAAALTGLLRRRPPASAQREKRHKGSGEDDLAKEKG